MTNDRGIDYRQDYMLKVDRRFHRQICFFARSAANISDICM